MSGTEPADRSPPTDRVVRLLELLAADPGRAHTLTELARALAANKSTIANITAQLVHAGWLGRHGARYTLGPGLVSLGRSARAAFEVSGSASPAPEALARRLATTVTWSALASGAVVLLGSTSPHDSADRMPTGLRVPFAPPTGAVFAAFDEEPRAAWLDLASSWKPSDREALAQGLAEVRRRGYAVDRVTQAGTHLRRVIEGLGSSVMSPRFYESITALLADLFPLQYREHELLDASGPLPVSVISAPVLDGHGDLVMSLSAHPLRPLRPDQVAHIGRDLVSAAQRWTSSQDPADGATPTSPR